MIDPQPAAKGVKTPFGSAMSKPARVNNPERTSGRAKKITTSGWSEASSLSHRLKTMNFPGALNFGAFAMSSFTISGVFLYRSPSSLPGMPQERKYSKLGVRASLNPV
jgi:hypothetical protein